MQLLKTHSHSTRGLSLLEVMLVITVVTTGLMMLVTTTTTQMASTRQSAEYAAAVRAARLKLEQLAAEPFNTLYSKYGPNAASGNPGNTFDVVLDYTPSGKAYYLNYGWDKVNSKYIPAGEIVIVNREDYTSAQYGRDLNGDGVPDGISFQGLPIDLNGNGNTNDGDVTTNTTNPPVRFPVGVVIRWLGSGGRSERYELWTVLNAF